MQPSVWTFKESLDFIVDHFQQYAHNTAPGRKSLRAIMNAYRDIPNKHLWKYYHRVGTFVTDEVFSGAITYDASTRIMTLTSGGSFPDSADLWRILLHEIQYHVESILSPTTVRLSELNCPAESIPDPVDIEMRREFYHLPVEFRQISKVWNETLNYEITLSNADAQERLSLWVYRGPSDPITYSIASHHNYPGKKFLRLFPFSPIGSTIRVSYDAFPRKLNPVIKTGLCSRDDAESHKIDLGETIPDYWIGSVIWISANAETPSSLVGGYNTETSSDHYNPYQQAAIITGIDGTSIIISEPSVDFEDRGYLLTDWIDIDTQAMLTLFQKMVIAEMAKELNVFEHLNTRENEVARALAKAREAERDVQYGNQETYWSLKFNGPILQGYQ